MDRDVGPERGITGKQGLQWAELSPSFCLSASAVPWHHDVLTVVLRALLVSCTVLGFKPKPGEQPLELGPSTPQGFEAKHLICQRVRWSGQCSALAQASSDLVSGK